MENIDIRLAKLNDIALEEYGVLVARKISARYSISAELSILRQRDSKPEEFAEYNAFAEACKAEAKAELGMED